MTPKTKFSIQEHQYSFPYHYLVDFQKLSLTKNLNWGFEYYFYTKRIIDYVNSSEYHDLLDIGCGDGKLISELSRINTSKNHVGYDMSEAAIFLAKGLNHCNSNCNFFCGDFAADKNTYDIICLVEVLEHIPDEEVLLFIKNIEKKLSPEGKIIISVPSINIVPVKEKHYRHYDINKIVQDFANFNLIKTDYLIKNNSLFKLICNFARVLPDIPALNRGLFKFAEKSILSANKNNCRHIVCILQKHLE
jgi:SAM-dependent methyltransferase